MHDDIHDAPRRVRGIRDPAGERRSDPGTAFPWDRFRELVLSGPPQPSVALLASTVEPRTDSIHVIGLSGERIECDPRFLDGVAVAEISPLVEALGFRVEGESGSPMQIRLMDPRRSKARGKVEPKPRMKAKKKKPRGGRTI